MLKGIVAETIRQFEDTGYAELPESEQNSSVARNLLLTIIEHQLRVRMRTDADAWRVMKEVCAHRGAVELCPRAGQYGWVDAVFLHARGVIEDMVLAKSEVILKLVDDARPADRRAALSV